MSSLSAIVPRQSTRSERTPIHGVSRAPRSLNWLRKLGQWLSVALGVLVVILGILIAPLPGPMGLPIMIVGLVLILRNAYWAKRAFVRAQYRYPRYLYPVRRLMRRNPQVAAVTWQQALRAERRFFAPNQRQLVRWRRGRRGPSSSKAR